MLAQGQCGEGTKVGMKTSSSRALSSEHLQKRESSLPELHAKGTTGMSRAMVQRIRLDSTMSASILGLRMNRQNLINEMRMHNGRTVSQFVLMKPRSASTPQRQLSPVSDPALRKRVEEMQKTTAQQMLEVVPDTSTEKVVLPPLPGSVIETRRPQEPPGEDTEVAADDERAGEPQSSRAVVVSEAEVTRELESRPLAQIFRSLQRRDGYGGLPRDRLPRCLEMLGFSDPDGRLVEEECQRAIPGNHPLGLSEFAKIAAVFSKRQEDRFREFFVRLDYRRTGTIMVTDFRAVLREFGFTLSPVALSELLVECHVSSNSQLMSWEQFNQALVLVHERFGFSATEVHDLEGLFTRYDVDGSGYLSDDELCGVMGWLGHPISIEQAQATLERFDLDENGVLDKVEFLLAVRSWKNMEAASLQALFSDLDADGDGIMGIAELVRVMEKLGYTVLPHVVEEGIRNVKAHATGLMFEEVLHLLQMLRGQECFGAEERNKFVEVFEHFDHSRNGQLRQFELARALNWLGYPLSSHRRAQLWVRVDVDKSGFLEKGEFMKLMRFLREEEAAAAREAIAKTQMMLKADFQHLLNCLGYSPAEALLDEAMASCLDLEEQEPTTPATLQQALAVVHYVRESQVVKLRENEGLSDSMVSKIKSRLGQHFANGTKIELPEIERLMRAFFPASFHSGEERQHLYQLLAEQGAKLTNLSDVYFLVKLYGEQLDERAWEREASTIKATGFSAAQVAQFREVFVSIDADGSGFLDEREIMLAFDEAFARNMVRNSRFMRTFEPSANAKFMDFPDFLRLVKMAED